MTIRTPLPPPPYLRTEVAAMFHVDVETVLRWRKAGKIEYFLTPGGHARYPRDTTDALLASRAGKS